MSKLLPVALVVALFGSTGIVRGADGPQTIAIGEWSKPVADNLGYTVRGRLVLCETVVAADRRETAVFVELQEAADSIGESLRIFCDLGKHDFRPEYKQGLQCQMRDKAGNEIAGTGFAFGGAIPRSLWITLPTDATIRLRATPFGMHQPGAIVVCPDLGKQWIIPDDDPGEYFLSGTFTVDPTKEQMTDGDGHVWRRDNRAAADEDRQSRHRGQTELGHRLLLREAVERAQAPDQIERGAAADVAVGKQRGQRAQGLVVGRIAELRHDHHAIDDQKIAVARWQPLAVAIQGPRQAQRDDFQRLAVLIGHLLKLDEVLLCRAVVVVRRVFAERQDDGRAD